MVRKHLERLLSAPGILIFKEKNGKRYFVCNTTKDFCKAAMKVLRGRLSDGYWYYDDELDPKEKVKKEMAEFSGTVYKEPVLVKDKTEAQKISDDNNIEDAFEFLYDRSDGEHEGMTIEKPESFLEEEN